MKKFDKKTTLLAAMVVASLAVSITAAPAKDKVVVTVGSEKVTNSEVESRIAQYPKEAQSEINKPENKSKLIDQLIDEKLIIEAGKKQGLNKTEEYKAQIKAAQDQLLISTYIKKNIDTQVSISESDARAYFDKNMVQFKEEELRNADHVLVASESDAKNILDRVKRGEDFAKLAEEKSIDPSAKTNKGNLGWFSKGQMVPEFETTVFGLKKGEFAMVKTQFGYHVIRLNDTTIRPASTFEDVKGKIAESLIVAKKREAAAKILTDLRKTIKIIK